MITVNPAERLRHHLGAIRRTVADRRQAREVLGLVLGLEASDDIGLRRALTMLDDLIMEVERRLLAIPQARHSDYLQHFPSLRTGLANVALNTPSPTAFAFLSDAALESLRLLESRLSEVLTEAQLPVEELADLDKQIQELFEEIEAAEVNALLKEAALDLLETLRGSISAYRIRGESGLEVALNAALGRLVRYYLYERKMGRDANEEPSFRRIWTVMVRFESILSRAATYGPLLKDFGTFLLGP